MRDPLEPTNTLLVGAEGPVTRDNLIAASSRLHSELRPIALQTAERLEDGLTGGDVYTDDKAPVEWLIDKSIVEYAAGGDPDDD
jgi:hypothetical protein